MERRLHDRYRKVFRPAYIEKSGSKHVAILRDICAAGAGFEGDAPLSEGETVGVTWGSFDLTQAQVKWTDGKRFGLELDVATLQERFPHAYRSVRIPVGLPATIFVNGTREDVELINISQVGASVSLSAEVSPGDLATICCGPYIFENASLKWSEDGIAGFRLGRAISIHNISDLLSGRFDQRKVAA